MSADDDVQLTDLEVIQQFSLAVRGAAAPRDAVVRALQADLAWLTGRQGGSHPEAQAGASRSVPRKSTVPVKNAPAKSTRARRS